MITFMQNKWQLSLIAGITILFLWSLFLRVYQLGSVPTGLYWDEVAILIDAKSVAETGKDMHGRPWYQVIYPSYGDYKLPVYIWATAASVKLFGANDLAVRVPSAVAGFSTILISGVLIKKLLELESGQRLGAGHRNQNKRQIVPLPKLAGVLTSLSVALSPWSILFSRTGFEAHVGQALLAASILFAVMSLKNRWLILLSPVLGLLATYSYFSVRFVWIGVFLVFAFLFIALPKLRSWEHNIKRSFTELILAVVLPLIIFGVGLLPMLKSPLYAASNTFRLSTDSVLKNDADVIQSNVYREQAGNTRLDRIIFYRWWLTGKKLLSNYADNLSLNFLFVSGDPNLRHGTGEHGLFFLIFMPFFFIGWYALFRSYPKIAFLFFCWWMFSLLPASVPNTTPHALRSINALLPLASVIGVGLAVSFLMLRKTGSLLSTLSFSGFSFVLIISLLQFSQFYFSIYPSLSASAWQGGFEEMAMQIFIQRDNKKAVYVMPFDDRFYLWLLAYGPYTPQQIQQLPKTQFQVRDFDQIYTEHLPTDLASEAVVVGTEQQVEEFVQKSRYQLLSAQTVKAGHQTTYQVAKVKKGMP